MLALRNQLVMHFFMDHQIMAVTAFANSTPFRLLTDRFDLLLLVVTRESGDAKSLFHYIRDGYRVQEIRLTRKALEKWVFRNDNRTIMNWLLQGEIWVDREAYLQQFKDGLEQFPGPFHERKLLKEFSLFLSSYLQSKEYVQEDHLLDAYNTILEALHHWARIAIVEEGEHPEVMVWKQVRKINPGIHKLYEELTLSGETLRQRIELVQLACDFSVMSKLERCCALIIQLLEERGEPCSIEEIRRSFDELDINFSLLLDKLVQKNLAREVAIPLDSDFSALEIRYTR